MEATEKATGDIGSAAIARHGIGRVSSKGTVSPVIEESIVIQRCRYVFSVRSQRRSAEYYSDVLGFVVLEIPDRGWELFQRDECVIMAGECRDALPADTLGDHSYFAYLEVDDAERLYTVLVTKGAEIVKPLRIESWGMSEFGIRTIDGHRIIFGSRAA